MFLLMRFLMLRLCILALETAIDMAAYAALVSLHHTVNALLISTSSSSSSRVSSIREILESAHEQASSLLQALEALNGKSRSRSSKERVDALEAQIRDSAHKLEDVLEFHELKQLEDVLEFHGDLSHDDCLQCYAASRTRLPRCLPAVAGRIFLDGCFLRYDKYAFFKESVDPLLDTVNCNSTVGNSTLPEAEFKRSVAELIDNVTATAAAARAKFAVEGTGGVFGLAECWNTVGAEGWQLYL